MSVERVDWSTMTPPAFPAPRKVEVAGRMEQSAIGGGYTVTYSEAGGDPLVCVWGATLPEARTAADASVASLRRIAVKHPNGIPFVRSRAQ